MMTNETALSSPDIGQLIQTDVLLQQVPSLALALHLLYEKHRLKSFWSPYISK